MTSEREKVDVLDNLMGNLGDWGRYQWWQFVLHILSALVAGLHMLSLVTIAAVPEHRCEIPNVDVNQTMAPLNFTTLTRYIPLKTSEQIDSCSIYNITSNETIRCASWVFNSTYHPSSRAIDWNFVCDRRWMGAVAQTTYMLGVFVGCITLGNLADKIGRKPVYCWSGLITLILGVGVAFTTDFYTFLVVRFVFGIFASAGSYLAGFVLTMELVGPSKRSVCGIAFQGVFATGIMLVAFWGAFIKDRQTLQIVYGLHGLLLVAHWWLMDESPRWLWANGRYKESVDIVKRALEFNGSPLTINTADYVSKGQAQQRTTTTSEAGLMDLFKTPNLRSRTLNISLCWFANSLVYYGLSLSSGNIKGNPFFILFVMGLIEIPGNILTIMLMDKLGRRLLTSFNMILGGMCCIVAVSITIGSVTSTTFVFLGKFLIACSFAIIYNYSAELFPTVIRNSALGLGGMWARISGALTPLITLLDSFDPKIPCMIFAIIAIASGFLTMFLPETLGKEMPSTIEDGENFGIGDTCFSNFWGRRKVYDKNENGTKIAMTEQLKPLNVTEKV
ncbi:organic cation transporter protein [Harmonia axyridis]|uniref:organic cation transporter protein n=1 Tax=Harmonia axyridis TaxID=115357 RepID=UPI001E2780B7|nr:organic cation transporter protein [Harmonia axyridis]